MIDKPELEIPTDLKVLGMTSFSVLRIIQTTIYPIIDQSSSSFRTAMKASEGTETVPKVRIRFLPSLLFPPLFLLVTITIACFETTDKAGNMKDL